MSKAKRRPAARRSQGLPIFPIAVALIVVLGVGLIVATVAGRNDEPLETAPVTVTGEALPQMVEMGEPDSAVGMTAPELVGEDFDGQKVEIRNDGRAKAIAFVAHWCPHCQNEVPRLNDYLDDKGMPEGVDLYFVSTRVDRGAVNYPPSKWLDREGVGDVPTIQDDDDSSGWASFGAGGFPYLVVLDKDHKVSARTTGELPEGEYDRLLGAVASG